MQIDHPVGNFKIKLIKFFSKILSFFLLNLLSIILKINKKDSELIISSAFYAPWKADKEFNNFFFKIQNLTLLDIKRAYTLWYFTSQLKKVRGSILDIGCCEGGSGFIMSKINEAGNIYLIDTFAGLIDEDKNYKKTDMVFTNTKLIERNIKKFNLKRIKISKCYFPKNFNYKISKIKISHIDVNTYDSTKNSFFFVDRKLIKGGIIIFDDYGIYTNRNIIKFIKMYEKIILKKYTIIYNFMGQCILIKK
jgi:O-methyltransferase